MLMSVCTIRHACSFYFRPSSLTVSSLFILVVAHVLGKLWHIVLPKADKGKFWAFLNPCDFTLKEHVAILSECDPRRRHEPLRCRRPRSER